MARCVQRPPQRDGTDYRFTGQRQLAGLGLYHMGARWVDSSLGRWLSADTLVPGAGEPAEYQPLLVHARE